MCVYEEAHDSVTFSPSWRPEGQLLLFLILKGCISQQQPPPHQESFFTHKHTRMLLLYYSCGNYGIFILYCWII